MKLGTLCYKIFAALDNSEPLELVYKDGQYAKIIGEDGLYTAHHARQTLESLQVEPKTPENVILAEKMRQVQRKAE